MTNNEKLSLWSALLININVMFGTGAFINSVNLSKKVGFLGFLSYAIVACILTPLIFSLAALLKKHPAGGFYTYAAQELSPLWGFLSAWAYFTGKLASVALLVNVFSSLIPIIIPPLAAINIFVLDSIIIALFMWMNHYGLKTGLHITYTFLFLKLTPILFAIVSGTYLWTHWSIPPDTLLWDNIPSTIPWVLYAFVGFETICAISLKIKNPEKNAAKAVIYSFIFSVFITILYQLIIFLSIGPELMQQQTFLTLFPVLFAKLFGSHTIIAAHMLPLLHIAIASAALGGSYGIIFSNSWNLCTLAENQHTFFTKFLTTKNTYGIPFGSVLVAGILSIIHLLITQGNQIILQQISVFGVAIAFMISVISLLALLVREKSALINQSVPRLALGSCLVLLASCIRNFIIAQELLYLLYFMAILGFGIVMYLITNNARKKLRI